MAKAIADKRKLNKIDLQNLSERDRDFLSLDVKDVMKKYKLVKQSVYDRRFALNKKIREAGLSIEDLLNNNAPKKAEVEKQAIEKKTAQKRGRKPKKEAPEPEQPKTEDRQQEPIRDIVAYEKPVPVIMKPIEINFGNFSVKLNGVPKKIAVNPETNAIEIDL